MQKEERALHVAPLKQKPVNMTTKTDNQKVLTPATGTNHRKQSAYIDLPLLVGCSITEKMSLGEEVSSRTTCCLMAL
jgi:hypothetical protein